MNVSAEIFRKENAFVRIGNNSADFKLWSVHHRFDQTDCGIA